MKRHRVEVTERIRFGTHHAITYRWTGPAPEPGQFVTAHPDNDALDPFLPRSFYVHDHEGDRVTLLFMVIGPTTRALASEANTLLVSAPLGNGFHPVETSEPLALVGGGALFSPLGLLSRNLAWRKIAHTVYIHNTENASREFVEWVSGRFPGAEMLEIDGPGLTAETAQGYGGVYGSGPHEFLKEVRQTAGAVPCQLALRERMACADGSCWGCAVPVNESTVSTGKKYARSCVDGPVFEAARLAW